jgi:hypothetical protein
MASGSVILSLVSPHWLNQTNPEKDLCLHGGVEFICNGLVFSDGTIDYWTVSAAALYFLRSLTNNHYLQPPYGNKIIPCCGFNMIDEGEDQDVQIIGCPNGIDFEILHLDNEKVKITQDSKEMRILLSDYHEAVVNFADTIETIYKNSQLKQPEDIESTRGNIAFWREWNRRLHMSLE